MLGHSVGQNYQQVGALPYRFTLTGELEILLVTSRGTGKWIIPKGWPMEGFSDAAAAAREAYEEAGVAGQVAQKSIGAFNYEKPAKDTGILSHFIVNVYPLCVDRQLAFWPEAHQRRTAWVSPSQAIEMIIEPSLCSLVFQFSETVRGKVTRRFRKTL